ncbi:2-oxoglutarate (2OG) and Fe(II)-dependent oxygenase superfamily protein [Euphorbia peplus]|nr:2-oxoglutarate (2OG) and Fe(II)-dependent oxygenase superfamily protein [Euphorbia peplus]
MSETEMNILQSYPPDFISTLNKHETLEQLVVNADDVDDPLPDLPVMDLENLCLEKLREACKNWGLFRVVNHGVPRTLLTQLEEHSRKIFSRPFDSKKSMMSSRPLSYFWGTPALTPAGAALSAPRNINWVEGFNVPLSQLSLFNSPLDPTLHSFRLMLEEYGKHLCRIGTTIFEAMLQTLDLKPENYQNYLSESTGVLRVYRYPQSSAEETWGIKAHTDSSVLSILSQEQVGVVGLQLLKDDQWLDVHPLPHTLLLNLGDMMQAISNDEYKSVTHRVKANKWQDRYSICYFVFPDDHSVISSSNYKPFTYSDFRDQVQQDVRTSGFKVGLSRFKLTHQDY